jgi:hypothetical protein
VKQSIFAVAGLLVAALAMPSQEATALVLPDIIVHTQVVVNPDFTGATNLTQFTTGTSTLSIDGVSAAATANIQPSPNQTVTASVDGLGQAIANTHLQYYFAITGPSGVEVPIIITASGEITPPTDGIATNSAQLYFIGAGPIPDQYLSSACQAPASALGNCTPLDVQPSFSIATPMSLISNTVFGISMDLYVSVTILQLVDGVFSASGFIDPIITIDPAFALADQFTIEFSPGVGNSPLSVPEPASLAIILAGLAGLAAAMRFSGTGTVGRMSEA